MKSFGHCYATVHNQPSISIIMCYEWYNLVHNVRLVDWKAQKAVEGQYIYAESAVCHDHIANTNGSVQTAYNSSSNVLERNQLDHLRSMSALVSNWKKVAKSNF